MNWKKLVNNTNATTFKWPEGWDTREQVAEQLECSPDRVREVLAPAIRAGAVEFKDFKIWEDGRFVRRTGFRPLSKAKPSATKAALSEGMRVEARRGGSQGTVTVVTSDKFTVDYDNGKQTTYSHSVWQKGDVRPCA